MRMGGSGLGPRRFRAAPPPGRRGLRGAAGQANKMAPIDAHGGDHTGPAVRSGDKKGEHRRPGALLRGEVSDQLAGTIGEIVPESAWRVTPSGISRITSRAVASA